jgi:Flp pilus assembly protein TadD
VIKAGRVVLAGFVCASLAGCEEKGIFAQASDDGTIAPTGSPQSGEFPDGLSVGHTMMANGQYELALTAYTRAVQQQGLNADVLSAIGSANLKLGRLKQAKKFLTEAVEKDQNFAPAWNNLGVAHTSLGEVEEAHQAFRAAFALDNGQSEEIWQNLLLAIENKNNTKERAPDDINFQLVRRGNGRFLLLETPK